MVSFRYKRIRIVAIPPGEAPAQIREQWVGLVLPLSPFHLSECQVQGFGVLSGDEETMMGYVIEIEDAIAPLARKSPTAAAWWRNHVPELFTEGSTLVFNMEVCELMDEEIT